MTTTAMTTTTTPMMTTTALRRSPSPNRSRGMREAVAYLRKLGHERIAYLSGLSRKHKFDGKLESYLNAIRSQGFDYGEELLLEGKSPYSTSVQDGYGMAKELVASAGVYS